MNEAAAHAAPAAAPARRGWPLLLAAAALLALLDLALFPAPLRYAVAPLLQVLVLVLWRLAEIRATPWPRGPWAIALVATGALAWLISGATGMLLLGAGLSALLVLAAPHSLTSRAAGAGLALLGALGIGQSLGWTSPAHGPGSGLGLPALYLLIGLPAWLQGLRGSRSAQGARIGASAATGLALVALGGWAVDSTLIVHAGTRDAPMAIDAALAILLAAVALWQRCHGRVAAARLVLLPAVVLAALALAAHGFGAVDARDWVPPRLGGTQMAPATAFALLLLTLGMLIAPTTDVTARWAASWACGFIAASITALGLLGYLLGLPMLAGFGMPAPMSLLTSLSLTMLGTALGLTAVAAQPAQRRRTHVLPLLVAVGAVLLTLLAWLGVDAELLRLTGRRNGLASLFLLAGLGGSVLLALTVRLAMLAREQVEAAEAISGELRAQVEQRRRAETALSASQRQVVDVLECVSDAVLMLDREWRFVYVNPQAERLLARRRRRLLGRCVWDLYPQAIDGFRADLHQALAEQRSAAFERYLPHVERWLEVRVYPHPNGVAVYFRDISERRAREQEARRTELLLEAAGRSARLGGWAVDVGRERVRWTDAMCAIHEVPPGTSPTLEEAIATYAPEWREVIRGRYEACVRDGAPWDEELEIITASGRRLWVRSIGRPEFGDDGRVTRVLGAFQDISEGKRAELLLREVATQKSQALENLQQLMDAAAEIICMVDTEGRFTSINAAARAIWGRAPEDLIGRSVEVVMHPDDVAATRAVIAEVMAGTPTLDFRNRNLASDGRVIHMQWSASWSPQSRQLCCIGRDRSAQHRTEQFEAGRRAILMGIAARQPLPDSLDALLHLFEAQFDGSRAALWLVDRGRLRRLAAPNLADDVIALHEGAEVSAQALPATAAAQRGVPVIVADATPAAWPALAARIACGAVKAIWALPVRASSGQVLAVLDVSLAQAGAPSPQVLASIQGVTAVAAIAIEQAEAAARSHRSSRRLYQLAEHGIAINRVIGHASLQQQLVDRLRRLVDARMAALTLVENDDWAGAMTAVSLAPELAHYERFEAQPNGRGIYAVLGQTRAPLRLDHAALLAHPRFAGFSGYADRHPPLRGLLAVPLTGSDERTLGVLMLSDKENGEFDQDDEAIALQFAHIAATALERARLIDRLRERDRFFDMARELFCVVDPVAGRFVQVNPAIVQLFGYSEQELLTRPLIEFVHPEDAAAATAQVGRAARGEPTTGFVARTLCADGSTSWIEWTGNVDSHGLYFAVGRNITERRRVEIERDFATTHDLATGLPRYPLLEAQLAGWLDSGRRATLMFIDLDHFHGINESMGHAVGDEALGCVADRMRAVLGSDEERVARFAGDEFVAIVPDLDGPASLALAQRLRAAIAEPLEGDGYRLFMTASIGISCAPVHGDNVLDLLRRAEAAMSQAKRHGRDGICEFSEERMQELEDRRLLGSRLREAIGTGELTLAFQPRVRALDRRVTGFEALARWDSAAIGSIPPGRFIPIAEALGLMPELGSWVLQQSCRQIRAWLDAGHRDFVLSVNVSAHQLQRPDLALQVRAALSEVLVPPHMLELELTESALMENVDRVQSTLADLKALGVSLALDDFGTGYSSLAYLKQFQLDKLKIDRSFVTDLPFDTHDVAIARTIVAMAHQLKMVVAAEGVENEAQASFLRDIGCDELQGFLFGRPLPAAAAEPLFGAVAAV